MAQQTQTSQQAASRLQYVPPKALDTPYPLIDSDPHIRRVYGYSRRSDWLGAAGIAALPTAVMYWWEWMQPANVGRAGWAKTMRLTGSIGVTGALLYVAQQSSYRFYGFKENKREIDMDMREMVDKVKKGEPLYGKSSLTPYMQGVAARNSRYSGTFLYVLPWFNFVNHEQHGIDTAKYYQQAERELEAGRTSK